MLFTMEGSPSSLSVSMLDQLYLRNNLIAMEQMNKTDSESELSGSVANNEKIVISTGSRESMAKNISSLRIYHKIVYCRLC